MPEEEKELDFSHYMENKNQSSQPEQPAVQSPFSELPSASQRLDLKITKKLIILTVVVIILIIIQLVIYLISRPPAPVRRTTSYVSQIK